MTLVLWSGGCDSTLALFLEAKKASVDAPVRALSVNYDRVPANTEQRRARAALLAEFKKRGLPVEHVEISVTQSSGKKFYANREGSGLIQPVIWIPQALPFLRETEKLVVGYIRTDCAFHYRIYICEMVTKAQIILGKKGEIIFPLEWKYKWDVIQDLRKEKLFDLVWWCEDPKKGKACGTCEPCIGMVAAEAVLKKKEQEARANKRCISSSKKRKKKKGK